MGQTRMGGHCPNRVGLRSLDSVDSRMAIATTATVGLAFCLWLVQIYRAGLLPTKKCGPVPGINSLGAELGGRCGMQMENLSQWIDKCIR